MKIEMSIEKKLELPEEPESPDGIIDEMLADCEQIQQCIYSANDALHYELHDSLEEALDDINWNLRSIPDGLIHCRNQYNALWEWGDAWKKLAINLMKKIGE